MFNSLASPPKFSWKFVILFRSGSAVSVLALTLTSCRLLMLTDYGCLFLYLVFFPLHTCIRFCYFRWSKSIRRQPCYSPWRKILFQRQRDVEGFFFVKRRKKRCQQGQPDKMKTVDSGPYLVARGNKATVTAESCQLFSKGPVTLADT